MQPPPVLGDVAPSADPDAVAGRDVIEEFDEAGNAARPAGQPVVQCQ